MDHSAFLKAVGVGLAVAAPVGPMSLLCMRTTLLRGWRSGLAIGAGVAAGDAIFAAIAALGLAGLSAFMLAHEKPLHLAAGLFLLWLGLTAFRRKRDDGARAVSERATADATMVLLAFANPIGPRFMPAGATRPQIETAFRGWTIVDETRPPTDLPGMPRIARKAAPVFYRMRRD